MRLIAFTASVTRALDDHIRVASKQELKDRIMAAFENAGLANRENFAALVSAGPPVSVSFRAISSSFLFI
jgi:hypothetical protein